MRKLGALLLPLILLAGLIVAFPHAAAAQQDDAQAQDIQAPQADPPSRIARLSYMEGSVSYQLSGDQDWVQADPNRPLTTGDNLWADDNSRAEFHIGSTAVRMSSQTGISVLTLDDRTAQIQLPQGTIEVHLRDQIAGDAFEIDTPNVALTLARAGEYVISTDPNGTSTSVIVREGEIQATGAGEDYTLESGQQYSFNGTDQLAYAAQAAPDFNDFENWCQTRDQTENASVSAQYVSRDVDGVYDLDQSGTWESAPDYGEVWIPNGVPVDWAPYRNGHWVWVAPWGWTWIESEPWGFAPFHYGRWVVVGAGWAWVPGPRVVRPVYAPAVVGFVGGGRFSLAVSFGGGPAGVAWFPLGPRDVYVPAYRCSPRYVQTLNVTNTRAVTVTNITNVYNNYTRNVNVTNVHYTYENNARAVTAVSRDTFVSARPVATSVVRVAPDQIAHARAVEGAPVAPTRASYVSSQARPAQRRPVTTFASRPPVVRLTPAAPVNRQVPVYTNDSRPFSQGPPRTATGNPSQPSNDGFRPFRQPAANNAQQPTQNHPNTVNRPPAQPPQQQSEKPQMRYAPPARANDKMYDVHPPLNQKQAARPRSEAPHAAPQEPSHSSKH